MKMLKKVAAYAIYIPAITVANAGCAVGAVAVYAIALAAHISIKANGTEDTEVADYIENVVKHPLKWVKGEIEAG